MSADGPAGAPPGAPAVKPPVERLYGRRTGHPLRLRQRRLLDLALPRLRFPLSHAADPAAAFSVRPARLWLEVGFGGGEHAGGAHAAQLFKAFVASAVLQYTSTAIVMPWEVGKLLLQVLWVPRDAGEVDEIEVGEDEDEDAVSVMCRFRGEGCADS